MRNEFLSPDSSKIKLTRLIWNIRGKETSEKGKKKKQMLFLDLT
jgi:hypothetical protein